MLVRYNQIHNISHYYLIMNELQQPHKQIQQAEAEEPQQEQQSSQQEQVPNEHHSLYRTAMQQYSSLNTLELSQRLANSEVSYSSIFEKKFRIKIVQSSVNKEVVVLRAFWGNFSLFINVLNIEGSNINHGERIELGNFADIYKLLFRGKTFVMKCIEEREKFVNWRARAIREWFVMKICSVLKVGPKVESLFGFDILMYSECVEFPIWKSASKQRELYADLCVMHQAHVVHLDIKNENIMFSPSLGKLVFIDFGFSRIISEDVGQRTLTDYMGSINFWSPEMHACFIKKEPMRVDLYYNDLHCLEVTLRIFKQMGLPEDEEDQMFYIFRPKLIQAKHLSIVLLKYYLYFTDYHQLQIFCHFWTKLVNTDIIYYETQLLQFLEEISPQKKVKKIFQNLVSVVHSETVKYTRIKLLYEVYHNTFFPIESMQNSQKLTKNSTLCDTYFQKEDEDKISQISEKMNIFLLLSTPEIIQKTHYLGYLSYYLEYLSYINNKFSVNAEKRQKLAKVYFDIFIQKQIKQGESFVNSQNLVLKTINHALSWLLGHYQQHQKDTYVLLFFRILDYIEVLYGPSKQIIQICDKIISHRSFSNICKFLFIKRVENFNLFNYLRIANNNDIGLFKFNWQVQEWFNQKKKKLKISLENSNIEVCCYFGCLKDLPKLLTIEFGLETAQYDQNQDEGSKNNYIDSYYTLILKHQHCPIYLFLGKLYVDVVLKQKKLCKQIKDIFAKNIADESIIAQFRFKIDELIDLEIQQFRSEKNNSEIMKNNQYLNSIPQQNLYTLTNSVEHLLLIQKQRGMLYEDSSRRQHFLYRCYSSFYKMVQTYMSLLNEHYNFPSLMVTIVNNLLNLSRCYSSGFQQAKTMLYSELNRLKSNPHYEKYKQTVFLSIQINQLRSHYQNCLLYQQNRLQHIRQAELFFLIYQKIIMLSKEKVDYEKQYFQMLQHCYYHGIMICYFIDELQVKYNGMWRCYNFCLSANNPNGIRKYLQLNRYFPILQKTINIIWKNPQEICTFVFNFSSYFEQNVILQDFSIFQAALIKKFKTIKEQNLWHLFLTFRKYQKDNSRISYCIALIYSLILPFIKNQRQQLIIFASIQRHVQKLHHNYQKHIRIILFLEMYMKTDRKCNRRKWIHYNNRLVKLILTKGQSHYYQKKSKKLKNEREKYILQKQINKLQSVQIEGRTIKYRMLK